MPRVGLVLPEVDLSALPEREREREWTRLVQQQGRKIFDLSEVPLFGGTLVHWSAGETKLLLTIHHIIADEWSMELLHKEVAQLYQAFSQGLPSPLADLPIQYADFACWQRDWLQGAVLNQQLDYWKKELAGAPQVLELASDRPRPAVQSFRGATEAFHLPPELLAPLKSLGRTEQATLFMVLQASFMTFLHRYTGQEDILVGTPISRRTHAETEHLIGYFLNTLILRGQFIEGRSFRSLLQQVRERALGAYAHADLPFKHLVTELAPARDPSRTPLFQTMFILHDPDGVSEVAKASSDHQLETATSKFDLTLVLSQAEHGLEGLIEYSTDLFDAATIRRMSQHYGTLLTAIAQDPDRSISALPMLSQAERQQFFDWNDTKVAYPADVCLHELFQQQVERTPQAVAVEFEGKRLTYAELNSRANQLAHYLRGKGVGPDTLVGVFMERSLEMVIALYGIVKAGGAYVPIDPEYPADRVAFMLEDAAVPVLLTQSHLQGQLPPRECQRLCLDTEWDRVAKESTANPLRNISAKNLAYMIYTSGSSGKPKGAMNEHRGITNRLLWMQDQYGLNPADKILQKTPFSFDVSVWEFFWPLLAGARLVVAKPGGHRDAAYLVDLIVKEQVTVLHFVPPMLRIFLEDPDVKSCLSLRHVICSGEALPYDLQEKFFTLLPAKLHNLYGPTEAAVDVTHYTCPRNGARKMVPIGRPVANTQIHILDPKLQPVPQGVTGELYIGGIQVGRGYHNRPELTAERFIADPFRTDDPEARLYKTGDECRWLSDGNIEYLGRADFQVKIRGFRIELGEIETALAGHPVVKECVVIAREDTPGEKMLVGYILPQPGATPEASDLRAHLKKDLPDYMVPSAFVLVERFPLSPNGKIDRKALPAPIDRVAVNSKQEFVGPRDETERLLARIWIDAFHVKQVGMYDNFFDLGGHSLLAVRIIKEIEALTTIRMPLTTLLEAPTIADLAEILDLVMLDLQENATP